MLKKDGKSRPDSTYMDGETRGWLIGGLGFVLGVCGIIGYTAHGGTLNAARDDARQQEYDKSRMALCADDPRGASSCLLLLEQIEECREQSTPTEDKTCLAELASARAGEP